MMNESKKVMMIAAVANSGYLITQESAIHSF
jgi:hypothetical protein